MTDRVASIWLVEREDGTFVKMLPDNECQAAAYIALLKKRSGRKFKAVRFDRAQPESMARTGASRQRKKGMNDERAF